VKALSCSEKRNAEREGESDRFKRKRVEYEVVDLQNPEVEEYDVIALVSFL
jgi:hypothetical protein